MVPHQHGEHQATCQALHALYPHNRYSQAIDNQYNEVNSGAKLLSILVGDDLSISVSRDSRSHAKRSS